MNTEGQPTLELEGTVRRAVRTFWATRSRQAKRQGGRSGVKDAGQRAAVTGGAQMDGFIRILRGLLIRCGFPPKAIFNSREFRVCSGWMAACPGWHATIPGCKITSCIGASSESRLPGRWTRWT